ncbi:MAG: hypothetical protein FWB86_05910 [Treponema sp.]|nr:hypothetical protein [Treponema sp.]MCL2251477.1 hypothetical protein [Treponema sp.]
MRYKYIFLFLIFLTAFFADKQSLQAQVSLNNLFKPFTSFRVIKTEYFDIIFPKESEASARALAVYADNFYEQLSYLFDIKISYRIPVTFAPHTDLFNGYFNPIPSTHIVLYDTPMDLEWTNHSDTLEGLFIHELTHAVTLNTRSPFYKGLRNIFGNWVSPSFLNAPSFMVEGAAIAIESLSGFGRANDPLIKQKLRQAIHEGEFLTPFQSSGVYDLPGQRGIWYEYGGLFSAWLVRNYGMEKYTELWKEMGKLTWFSFFVYNSGYYRIFKKVYDIKFLDAWNDFSASLALENIEENENFIYANNHLSARYHFFSERKNSISALASNGSDIYILDASEEKIIIYNTQTQNVHSFKTDFFTSYDLDVNTDGSALLVSGYRITGDMYSAFVTEHDTVSGRKTGRNISGLYKARYFRDGVIGLSSELHNNCIVYNDFNGNSKVLFRGNSALIFSGPQVLDNERIVFIAARKGVRELLLFNFVTNELFCIETADGNDEYRHYMRGLGVSEGKIFFSHNDDDRMYKLGFIDPETMQAVLSRRDFSGGVFYPVSANDNVYYCAEYFYGDSFLCFPEPLSEIAANNSAVIDLSFIKINNDDYGFNNLNTAFLDNIVAPNDTEVNINQTELTPSKPYFSIAYMINPFKLWLPLPLLRYSYDNSLKLDGGGLFSVLMDPTDRNLIIFTAYADITYRMAMIDNFIFNTTAPGFLFSLEFSDKVITELSKIPSRDTRLTMTGSMNFYPGRWAFGFALGGGYAFRAYDNGAKSAYEWSKFKDWFYYSAAFIISNNIRRQHEVFGTGVSFNLRGINIVDDFSPRAEAMFQANIETRFPLKLALYGAYDKTGMNVNGASQRYGQPLFVNFASAEYPNNLNLEWLFGGEILLGIFSFEIQKNLSHAYFNRMFGTISVRNVLYGSNNLTQTMLANAEGIKINDLYLAQSLILNLKIVSAIIPIKYFPLFIEPHFWGAWKFSNTITGKYFPWAFGFNMSLRY